MKKVLDSLHFYWKSLFHAAKTRIIAIDHSCERDELKALEFHPQTKLFSPLSPRDSILENKDDLVIASLDSSELFYGKIEGLPISVDNQLFHRNERIEGQIAQKVLWDLSPYSYLYEFRKIDAKKTDLHFVLSSKKHLNECKAKWNQKSIFPSIITTSFSALVHYLQFEKVPFPCIVLLKKKNRIEKYEFENPQDITYSIMEEMDLFSFGEQKGSEKFIVSDFASPIFESDLYDPDLFMKGLCLTSQSPLQKWSSDSWIKQLHTLLPLTIPSGKKFKKGVYNCLGVVVFFSVARFFSFYHDLRTLDDDLPFWQVADEKVHLEKDYSILQHIASDNQAMKEALHQKSVEKITLLARDLYPLSIQIEQKEWEVFFAPLRHDEEHEKQKKEFMKKVDQLHGSVVRDDQKVLVISFPVGEQ